MREYSTPMTVEVPRDGNLTDAIVANATERPDSAAFSIRDGAEWADVSSSRFLDDVVATAKGLVATGVGHGDRVALLCRPRYEWTVLDYAIWYVGAVTVPLYPTAPAEQVERILVDSRPQAVVVETDAQRSRVEEVDPADGRQLWCLEHEGLTQLRHAGSHVSDAAVEERRTAVTPGSPATIIYTSGTTGEPKGCVLTHGNLMYEVSAALDQLPELFEGEEARTLVVLPLAHVFARVLQIGCVRAGVRLAYSPDPHTLRADVQSYRPTFLLAVPRVFERIYTAASQQAAADGRAGAFDRATDAAIAFSRALDGRGPGRWMRARHRMLDRRAFAALRDMLGGRCQYVVSGGAPLGDSIAHFYRGIGVTVLEGYGLTESSGALTVNRAHEVRLGTVGQPLPGTSIRVADDGEVLARGPQVSVGYWRADAKGFDETVNAAGWLHTGDLGEIDDAGFLRVTGRKKEILVTAGGKHVAPERLEEQLRSHPLVSQCMVVGDGQPFLGALVTLDPDAVEAWRRAHGSDAKIAVHRDPAVRAEIETVVDRLNGSVSPAEAIRAFTILADDWTEESGHLTPSLKLRRRAILRDYRAQVESLFDR